MPLPAGFSVPPLPYLLLVAGAVALALAALALARPAVTEVTVVAFAPWMVTGAGLYALYQVAVIPAVLAPLFGSPTVYLTTFAVMAYVWALASLTNDDPRFGTVALLVAGLGAMSAVLGLSLVVAFANPPAQLLWPTVGLVLSAVVAGLAWIGLREVRPGAVRTTATAGFLGVFAHTLDGVSTAVGIDVLGFGEQTPLSQAIIEVGAALPTEPYVGSVWLFVLVKVLLGTFVVAVLADYVREDPRWGFLLLAGVTAVGLGPGAHNLVLFAMADPVAPAASVVSVTSVAPVPSAATAVPLPFPLLAP
ncbi:DUF63 family protein [Halomarina pelagica]|uniref:DUF63 family protein n=1 Tax=Halomarina pelagica TaxID=2961599 RepID=UPI0020C53619|nr:DUF63 family protein [Halomarina sp. BND7]